MNRKAYSMVSNPMLLGTIELLKAENTVEHQNIFGSELLNATFLAPVVITPEPEKDENGRPKMSPNSQISFPMIQTKDGKFFFMAYTDANELQKWKGGDTSNAFALKLEDYAQMLNHPGPDGGDNPALGLVIDPYGCNLAVFRDMVERLVARKTKKVEEKEDKDA